MSATDRSPRPTSGTFSHALREFLATELAGGVVLLVATAAALAWANSPWAAAYDQLWHTDVEVGIGRHQLTMDLRHWVNDGLMAVFFLVVGLEVKREFLQGELRDRRRAMLPIVAAAGGMAVPALLYLAVNRGGDGAAGWGIPMATDIAFALGVLALVARTLPPTLRIFLLALAIVDDIGAIVVIAVFYSATIDGAWLAAGVGVVLVVLGLRQVGLSLTPVFVLLGAGLWLALHASGVHATLAGVVMGLLAPATPRLGREIVRGRSEELLDVFSPKAARATSRLARMSVSELEWLEHGLHPLSSLLVVPVFAFANAGVSLSVSQLETALTSPVTLGVVVGLVVGKIVGITGAAWLACRLGWAELGQDVVWRQVAGVAALGGIGFTVSLFITGLAFDSDQHVADAKVGILAASLAASLLGAVILRRGRRPRSAPRR